MMNMIVSLMAAGAKKRFSREEYRQIREEANALFQKLTKENKDLPKAQRSIPGQTSFRRSLYTRRFWLMV